MTRTDEPHNRREAIEMGNSKRPKTKADVSGDWRGEMLALVRRLIKEADPDAIEEVKWRKPSNPDGVPTWSHSGILCTGEAYKDKVKLTFARGAALDDPARLFNASLDAGTRRAIDIREGERIDDGAFKDLIRQAVKANAAKS